MSYPVMNKCAAKIGPSTDGGPQLDLSGVSNLDISISRLALMPEPSMYEHEARGDEGTQNIQIGEKSMLEMNFFLDSLDMPTTFAKLKVLESRNDGKNRAVLFNQHANDLVPALGNPVQAGWFTFPQFPHGGDINKPFEFQYKANGSGAIEEFTVPFAAPADGAAGSPATTTLTVSFTAVITKLLHVDVYRYQRFDIYQAETTGGQDFSLAPAASVVNDGTAAVTEIITGLTAATEYFFVIEAVGYFDVETARSAEFSGTTSA